MYVLYSKCNEVLRNLLFILIWMIIWRDVNVWMHMWLQPVR
jgi:hypothetical protein